MSRRAIAVLAFGAVVLALAAAGYWGARSRQEQVCGFCQRPVSPATRAVAEIDGRRETVCCPRCAVTEGRQEKKTVRLIEVTDYTSGAAIRPEAAFYVEGSHKMACSHDAPMLDESKHEQPMVFDRCAPGAFAFARRQDAEAFVRENGGVVVQLRQLMGEVR